MRFLRPLYPIIIICIRKLKRLISFFLSVVIFFIVPTVAATPPFQDYKDDLVLSDRPELVAIIEPKSINPKGQFMLHVKMNLREGWHIYSLEAKRGKEESLATRITLSSGLFLPQGPWAESSPTMSWDGVLEKMVKIHGHTAEFSRRYTVAKSIAPGSYWIKGIITFSACDNKICTLPQKMPFKVEIKVMGRNK